MRCLTDHLRHLVEVRDGAGDTGRLEAVLEAYALIAHRTHGRHDADLVRFLHHDDQVAQARHRLHELIRDVLAEAGAVRADELATYCLHALSAAADLPSEAAVHRLVQVTLPGCGPKE